MSDGVSFPESGVQTSPSRTTPRMISSGRSNTAPIILESSADFARSPSEAEGFEPSMVRFSTSPDVEVTPRTSARWNPARWNPAVKRTTSRSISTRFDLTRSMSSDLRRSVSSRMMQIATDRDAHTEIVPEGSVYSYLVYMLPIEERRKKRCLTPLTLFAFVLCGVNFLMQFGLLYVVGEQITAEHSGWVGKLTYLNRPWYHLLERMPYERDAGLCRTPDSPLCFETDSHISCSPPSLQVLSDWKLLDKDNDGVWSRTEAEDLELQSKVMCNHNLDLLALYDSVTKSLNSSHVLEERRNQALLTGQGIHKAYFDWHLHKPLLCMYGDERMCGNLFKRGFFDIALEQVPLRAFRDAATAMQYCQRIIKHECFHIFPGTYTVWRLASEQQCSEKQFTMDFYRSPTQKKDDFSLPIVTVGVEKRDTYQSTKSIQFRLFLGILMTSFITVMYFELRSICKHSAWCIFFPVDYPGSSGSLVSHDAVELTGSKSIEGGRGEEEEWYRINKVRLDHKLLVSAMQLLRVVLWIYLLQSGIMFLTGAPQYLNLIFDSLSLVFILNVDELLYTNLISRRLQDEHIRCEPMTIRHEVGRPLIVCGDMAAMVGVILFTCGIVYSYCLNELNPVYDSLNCVCLREGQACLEATKYSKAFWDHYWSSTLPQADLQIDSLLDS